MTEEMMQLKVARIVDAAEAIKTFELVDPNQRWLPAFTAGAHVYVETPGAIMRQYSLSNDASEKHRYVIGVLRDANSRGGSIAMHDGLAEGDLLPVSLPKNNFPLSRAASHHLLIAGGIGITPVMAMVRQLAKDGADYTLHYCTRSPAHTAYLEELIRPPFAANVRLHHDGGDPRLGLDVRELLSERAEGVHVYCCGPAGLIDAVETALAHWPEEAVHFERFSTDREALKADMDTFEVEVASSGQVLQIPDDKSILEVLRENGYTVESVCEEGICGECALPLLEGEADHRDIILSADDKENNRFMTVCCSRSKSPRLKLDL